MSKKREFYLVHNPAFNKSSLEPLFWHCFENAQGCYCERQMRMHADQSSTPNKGYEDPDGVVQGFIEFDTTRASYRKDYELKGEQYTTYYIFLENMCQVKRFMRKHGVIK